MSSVECAPAPSSMSHLFLSDAEYGHELDLDFATAQEFLEEAEQDFDEADLATHESIQHAHIQDVLRNIKPDELRVKLQRERDNVERVKNPEIENQFKYKGGRAGMFSAHRIQTEESFSHESISSMSRYEMELDASAQERHGRRRERLRREKMKQIVSAPASPRHRSTRVTSQPSSPTPSFLIVRSNPTSPRFVAEQSLYQPPPTRLEVIAIKASAAASKLSKLARKISDNISRKSTPSTSTCNSPTLSPRSTPRISIDPDAEHIPSSAIKGRTSSAAYRALMENCSEKLEKERMSPRTLQAQDEETRRKKDKKMKSPRVTIDEDGTTSPKQCESPRPPVPSRPSAHSYSAHLNQMKSSVAIPPPPAEEEDCPPPPPPEEEH